MSKAKQLRLLRQCALLFAAQKTCNEPSILEWLKLVYFAHNKGYLYCGFDEDGNIDMAVIAYRIKHIKESEKNELPLSDSGRILYVSAAASISDSNLKLLRLMRWYLKNNLEINLIAYDYRNSEDLRLHNIRRIKPNGKKLKT